MLMNDKIRSVLQSNDDACLIGLDSCIIVFVSPQGFVTDTISEHGYDYSMGIGDAWSVAVPTAASEMRQAYYGGHDPFTRAYFAWQGGSAYNYGMLPPRYPVPALRRRLNYRSLWSVLRWIGYLPSHTPRF